MRNAVWKDELGLTWKGSIQLVTATNWHDIIMEGKLEKFPEGKHRHHQGRGRGIY